MKITPALAYEKLRQDAQSQNKIILHKDGKFYHVYEWSAWLLKSVNSFLGVLSHYSSFNIRSRMFFNSELLKLGTFNREMTQFTLRQ